MALAATTLVVAALVSPSRHAQAALPARLLSAPVGELRARIDHDAASAAKVLSPDAREAYLASLRRFYDWVDAYCGVPDSLQGLGGDASRCVQNEYFNYLARIPASVYRVGGLTIYETGVYALQWADDNLQGADPQRPFLWTLSVIWPRVDASPGPMLRPFLRGLADEVRESQSDWVKSGWVSDVDVHIETVNACYASASITASTYSGGAHPYESFLAFNWDQGARRPLTVATLFRTGSDWQRGLLALYRKHLASIPDPPQGTPIPDADLALWVTNDAVVTDAGLKIIEHEGRYRSESIPAVEIPWSELAAWMRPPASCAARQASPLPR